MKCQLRLAGWQVIVDNAPGFAPFYTVSPTGLSAPWWRSSDDAWRYAEAKVFGKVEVFRSGEL